MVRLEDDQGNLVSNHYAWSAPPKGPPVPRRSSSSWIDDLNSGDAVEQLCTLVWLTGYHLQSDEPRHEDHNQESVEDSQLYEQVRDSEETGVALHGLTKSHNPWIREYAELAAE